MTTRKNTKKAQRIVRSDEPTLNDFSQHHDTHSVLMDLRSIASGYLPHLPAPLGLNQSHNNAH